MSLANDLKALVNPVFLNTQQSEELLLDIKTDLINTTDMELILADNLETSNGKVRNIINLMLDEIEEGRLVDDVFLSHNLIDKNEYLIMKKANGYRESINLILEFRKNGDEFLSTVSRMTLPINIAIFLAFLITIIANPYLLNFIEKFKKMAIDKSGYASDPELPFFIENINYSIAILVIQAFLLLSIFFTYKYLCKNKIEIIYKLFPMKFYDDMIRYFTIASSMAKVDAKSDDIFDELSQNAEMGVRQIFKRCYKQGKDFAEVFQLYNAPVKFVKKITRDEKNSNFLKNMDETIEILKERRTNRKDFIIKYYAKTVFYLSLLFGSAIVGMSMVFLLLNVVNYVL